MNKRDYIYNLSKFKGEKTEKCLQYYSLSHSANNKYYTKIDNYYHDGRARYFWTKEEWDAYNREKKTFFEANQANKEAAIKAGQNSTIAETKKENEKNAANKLYQYKDEIIKKTNVFLKKADEIGNDFYDKFTADFPPELKNKLDDVLDKIKNSINDSIKNISDIDYDQVTSVSGLIDKIVDNIQDEINKYSGELSVIYEKFKNDIIPIFKDDDGNMNWKLYLPVIAGAGAVKFFIDHPDTFFEVVSKIRDVGTKVYDAGEKAFKFIDEKTNGKFSKALKKIPRLLDRYVLYKNFKNKGFDKFTVDDEKYGRITYLELQYQYHIKDFEGGPIESGAKFLFGSPTHWHTSAGHKF